MRKLAFALAIVALGYGEWLRETRLPLRPPEAPPLSMTVPAGATAASIGRQLAGVGLVRHPLVFRLLVLVKGQGKRLRAGDYVLDGPLSLRDVLDMLARGETANRGITFPEGKNIEEMAEIAEGFGLRSAEFVRAARDASVVRDLDPAATDLEGYLFPDTYQLSSSTPNPERALVGRMVQRFRDAIGPEREALAKSKWGLREVVTLASLVELETGRPDERPRIASVFLNRLGKNMRLQTDPTVIYALRHAGRYDGNIRKKDLDIDSPYNTYRRAGLPPGPIASPGVEAIRAVLHPAAGDALYFVSRNDGSHQFSASLVEHNRAVNRYQRSNRASPPVEGSPGPS